MISFANTALRALVLGRGLSSPLTTNINTGDIKGVEEEENIEACVRTLCSALRGERVMRENMGLDAAEMLFENIEGTMDTLPVKMKMLLEEYEPRITKVQAVPERLPPPKKGVLIRIKYTIRATGRVTTVDIKREQ